MRTSAFEHNWMSLSIIVLFSSINSKGRSKWPSVKSARRCGSFARGVSRKHAIPISKPRSPCSCSVVSNPMSHFRSTTAQFAPAIRNTFSDSGLKAERNFNKSEKWMNRRGVPESKTERDEQHFFDRNFKTAVRFADGNLGLRKRGTSKKRKK